MFPCLLKSNTANEHTYPKESTWIVNSRKKSITASLDCGNDTQSMNGANTTDVNSYKNNTTLYWNF